MVPSSYLLSIAAFSFVLIQLCSAMTVGHSYPPLMGIDKNYEQIQQQNGYLGYVPPRLAHVKIPSTFSKDRPNKKHDSQNFSSTKREGFGRKHHWDAFFGRR